MSSNIKKLREDYNKKKAALKAAEDKEALRIGRLALSAGALDYDISNQQWNEIFQSAVNRFSSDKN